MAKPRPGESLEAFRERQAKYVQKWRQANPEKERLARKRAYDNRKRKGFDRVGGAICRNCGCTELHALEFNHKNGNGCKDHRESGGRAMVDRVLTDSRNTDDLEVLCRICNALDHIERKLPHVQGKFKVIWYE